ncbi:MAG TPA: hypothetical protein V6C97_27390 [Oculatellaceae cyanobacterium]
MATIVSASTPTIIDDRIAAVEFGSTRGEGTTAVGPVQHHSDEYSLTIQFPEQKDAQLTPRQPRKKTATA